MPVDDQTLKLFERLATPTLANALDDVAFEGVMSGLAQIVPGSRCVGRAQTVLQVAAERGAFTSDDFKVGHMIEATPKGDILVIDNAGREVSTFGGLATFAAKMRGLGGVIVDGGVRDREEMLDHKVPVFARHMTPLTGRTRLRIAAIGDPIQCGGVRVRAGDVIVADGSGVVCIPAEHARRVAELAAGYQRDDEAAQAELAKGLTFPQAMAKFKRI